MQAAVLYYRLYYLPLAGVLLWVLLRHPEVYPTVRRALTVMASLTLLVFWLVPMSPPRFALTGIVDIAADHDLIGGGGSRDLTNGQNHFSAMPSLRVGWSALCAYAAWLALRHNHPRLALLAWLFPFVMIADVITTAITTCWTWPGARCCWRSRPPRPWCGIECRRPERIRSQSMTDPASSRPAAPTLLPVKPAAVASPDDLAAYCPASRSATGLMQVSPENLSL